MFIGVLQQPRTSCGPMPQDGYPTSNVIVWKRTYRSHPIIWGQGYIHRVRRPAGNRNGVCFRRRRQGSHINNPQLRIQG